MELQTLHAMDTIQTLLTSAALVVGLSLLWTGRRRLAVSSFQAVLLSVIDVVSFGIFVAALGWLGVAILVAVNLVAATAWSVVLAIKKQSILAGAGAQGTDIGVDEADEIWQWMKKQKSFAVLDPLKRAELIRALASQARNPDEIRAMAVPIAQLAVVFDCDPIWLAPRFDQLLRLYGHDATEAMDVADTLTRGTQLAPASFKEMVEAMLIAGGADPLNAPADAPHTGGSDSLRENLRSTAEIQLREGGTDGVRLNGGPMDGWLVLNDAPSLATDWYKTWPPSLVKEHEPGRYQLADSGTWAEWIPLGAS